MLALSDNLSQSLASLCAHKLRTVLTVIGLMMGVATLITVMTIVQGANLYVEQKIANLGTNVFQIARTPFAVTDFNLVIKALKNKHIEMDDLQAVSLGCSACKAVGANASSTVRAHYKDRDLEDVNLIGHTTNMTDIDTRTPVPSIPATLSPLWVSLGVAISVGVGLFFGYYPANRAANLDSITCLRYE
jgi:putative ABC transport system permease protein